MNSKHLTRRQFLGHTTTALLATAALPQLLPSHLFGAESAGHKLNVACLGMGGQMHALVNELAGLPVNVVALCDLDSKRIEALRRTLASDGKKVLADAKVYRDYRQLLEREKSADAVVIATPDHWHALLCTAAIQAGKHVYCEKPLTHTVAEARALRELSRQSKVVTQTGNQGSASGNFRRSMELIQAGVLGTVREVHIWHPPHGWPSGIDRPAGADPVPEGFDWNFWLGPAPLRPYKQGIYHPGAWRGWYDFGGGSLADFCCHAFSMPVRALELDYPSRIEVSSATLAKDSFPKSCQVHFTFPARGNRGPISIHFYTGGDMPQPEVTAGLAETLDKVPTTGCLVLGDKGTLSAGLWNNECRLRMKGETSFSGTNHDAAKAVPQTLPRARGSHVQEWVEACQGGAKTFSPFEIGGHITEIGAAGLIALRLGRAINWDGVAMQAKGEPAAAPLVKPQARKEWAP